MLEWGKVLIKHQTLHQELYERYIQIIREMKTFFDNDSFNFQIY